MTNMRTLITILLLISLLLPVKPAFGFEDLDVPRLGASIIDADTGEARLDIGTKNILVTVDIPTYIFEEEKEKLKVDLRVTQVGKEVFKREDQGVKNRFKDEEERTKTDYLFSLDSPLQEKDKVEMCFTLLPSGRGACGGTTITKDIPDDKSKKSFNNQVEGGDIAENMIGLASENLEPGDLVASFDKDNKTNRVIVAKTSKSYQKELIGVVSMTPGVVLEDNLEDQISYPIAPIALVGIVETKVSDQNGPISIGDMITSSNTPGIGMRATGFGPVVGKALEPLESGSGKIKVLISLGWYGGSIEQQGGELVLEGNQDGILSQEDLIDITTGDPNLLPNTNGDAETSGGSVFGNMMTLNSYGDIVFSSGIVVTNPSYLGKLTMMGDINLNGHEITNIGGLAGKDNKWMIDENGNFITSGLIAQVVDTSEGQKTMYAMTSPQPEYTISGHGQLSGGGALIEFESWFSDIISSDVELKVVVTPTDVCNGLYITSKAPLGFIVREQADGTSNAQFDWIAIARQKGYESIESVWNVDGGDWHIIDQMANDQMTGDEEMSNDQNPNDQDEESGDGEEVAGDSDQVSDDPVESPEGDNGASSDETTDSNDQSQDDTETADGTDSTTDDTDSTTDEQEDSDEEETQEETSESDTETQETEEGAGDEDTAGSQSSEDEQTN